MASTPMEELTPNAERAARFLHWLSPTGPHRIETIASEGKAPLGVRTFRDNQSAELKLYIATQNAHDARRNIYFLPNAAHLSGDRKKDNVGAAGYLHVDLDAKDYPGTQHEQLKAIIALLLDPRRRPKGIPQPTAVCLTGGGYQAFWKLVEPVEPELAEELNYSLLVALEGGLGTHNVDRLMRLPYTVNWLNDTKRKAGREPAFALFVEPANFDKPPVEYEVTDFQVRRRKPGSAVSSGATSSLDIEAVGEPKPLPEDLSEIIPSNPEWALAIATGENPEHKAYESRSELVFGGAKWMLAKGVDPGYILSILTDPGYGISAHVLEQADPLKYAKRQVARAKASLDQGEKKQPHEILVLAGHLPEAVDKAEQALIATGVPIYQRYDMLVRPVHLPEPKHDDGIGRDSGALITKNVTAAWVSEQFARSAQWFRVEHKKRVRISPPAGAATAYLSRAGNWDVPVLAGITQRPTLRRDGTVLQTPGYDRRSGLIYDPGEVVFPLIPEEPTKEEAERAIAQFEHLFSEFSFVDETAKSVALAAALTALVPHMFGGIPLFAFDAPVMGTGKSYLVKTITLIATGHAPAVMSQGKTEEENEKRLASAMIASDSHIAIDNCERPIEGDFLCSLLTEESVQVRILGRSEVTRLLARCMVMATGNNLVLSGDITRRALICRLDARSERPDLIQYSFSPADEVRKDPAKYVCAGLKVLRAYIAAGRPQKLDKIASFEGWNVVREAIVWLGREDPAQSRERILLEDPQKGELIDLLRLWWAALKGQRKTLAELHAIAEEGKHPKIGELVSTLSTKTRQGTFNARSIGKYLTKQVDRIAGGLALHAEIDSSGTKRYWMVRVEDVDEAEPSTTEMPF